MLRHVIKCDSGRTITFRVINPRLIIMTPLDITAEVYGDDGIVRLDYDGELEVQKGEVLNIKRRKFKPFQIKRVDIVDNYEYGEGYYIYTSVLNMSTRFIMPLLGGDKHQFCVDSYLMNCFIGVEDQDYGEYIYLWYRYIPDATMESLESFIFNHPCYVSHEDVDNYHVLYKMRVPETLERDYRLIVNGKYSKIHIDTKTRILKFHNTTAERPLGQVLFQAVERRKKLEQDLGVTLHPDAELYDKFHKDREIFRMEYVFDKDDPIKDSIKEAEDQDDF